MGSQEHDVCFILEGTYPFVTGGVSAWVHNLIRGLPEISFTGISILPSASEERPLRYELPDNFRDMHVIYLHDHHLAPAKKKNRRTVKKQVQAIREFHEKMKSKEYSDFPRLFETYKNGVNGLNIHDLMYGKDAWNLLTGFYGQYSPEASFIDYFWTYRVSHLPLFTIMAEKLPRAKVYHTVSTGYAGFVGVMAKYYFNRPLLLTEHGIYTKERRLEISTSRWIPSEEEPHQHVRRELGTFRDFWMRVFRSMGKLTYHEATMITTIYEGNRLLQIADDADPQKIAVIPNGIDVEQYSGLKDVTRMDQRGVQDEFVIGFIGRVVQIKDVKTFIRACKIASFQIPKLKVEILGPTDEDPDYFEECRELVHILDLDTVLTFRGSVRVPSYLPQIDLVVLTSISEAQPLVILEANCTGIPVVASDVGACRDLLLGLSPEDKSLGPSGMVTKVADPAETAQAMVAILSDPVLRSRMKEAGMTRVRKYYTQRDLNTKYLSIYQRLMEVKNPEEVEAWRE